jgi:hypothetical protein
MSDFELKLVMIFISVFIGFMLGLYVGHAKGITDSEYLSRKTNDSIKKISRNNTRNSDMD